jgi:hypothetical protein
MSTKYAKLTKSELLLVIDQLEAETQELSDYYEAQLASSRLQTVPQLWENFVKEAKLLGEDLLKVVGYVYDAGVKARKAFGAVKVLKAEPVVEVQVNGETSFPY